LYADDTEDAVDLEAVDRHQQSFMYHVVKKGRLLALLLIVMLATGMHWLIWPIAILAFGIAKRAVSASRGRQLGRSCFLHPQGD
jgi:hypothetical protein